MLSRIIFITLAYFATGWLGLQIPYAGSHITLVWLPTGIAVASLIRWGLRFWPGVFIGALLVNLLTGAAWPLATGIAAGNTMAAVLCAWWLNRLHFNPAFERQRDVAALIAAAAGSMLVSSSLGTANLFLADAMPPQSIGSAWISWWMGDTVGVLLAAPLVLALTRKNIQQLHHDRREALLWLILSSPMLWFAFIYEDGQIGVSLAMAFMTLPLLAWAALRFGKSVTAIAALGFSVIAAWSTALGKGFFILGNEHISLFLLWSYMSTIALTGLLITALQAERLTTENSLRENEEKLRGLFELSPIGIALTDIKGRYIEFNRAFLNICGYTSEELEKLDYWALTPKKYEAEEIRQLEMLERTGRYGPYEKEYLRKDGSLVPLNLNGVLITNSENEQYIWSIVEDVTLRRQSEANQRLAATAFEAQVGIIVTDAHNVILKVNRAFSELTGYTAEEVIGKTPRILKSGRHDAVFYAEMWKTILRDGVWQGEIWDRRKNGEIYPKWMTISAVKDENGDTTHFVSTNYDISEQKKAEDEIRHLAFYDPLTGLPNRRNLLDRLQQALANSARNQQPGALLFIDLDHFKTLNDTLGHDKGDLLLQLVAQRLATCVREGDTVARLGGDEFVVMLEDLNEKINEAATQAETVGLKIITALNQSYLLEGHEHHSSASAGITLFGYQNEQVVEELLKQADLAMYQAKATGRNALRFFDPQMQASVTARADLEKDMRNAISEQQFVLYYQAQVNKQGSTTGAEVLLRWQHPVRGLVFPDAFIPLAEESGMILPLGLWVLKSACAQLAIWARQPETHHLTLAVNVSAQQVRQPDFVEQVLNVLDQTGADPVKLKLELTESMLLHGTEDTITKMIALKERGVGFLLDDFGTGYSSLSYLKRLPLEKLKIDRSFVMDVLTDPSDAAIAKTIVVLAESLGLKVIAEGVETEEQRDFLADNGCYIYQGYLFSRPIPVADFEQFLNLA